MWFTFAGQWEARNVRGPGIRRAIRNKHAIKDGNQNKRQTTLLTWGDGPRCEPDLTRARLDNAFAIFLHHLVLFLLMRWKSPLRIRLKSRHIWSRARTIFTSDWGAEVELLGTKSITCVLFYGYGYEINSYAILSLAKSQHLLLACVSITTFPILLISIFAVWWWNDAK